MKKPTCPYCYEQEGVIAKEPARNVLLENGDPLKLQLFAHPGCKKPSEMHFGKLVQWQYIVGDDILPEQPVAHEASDGNEKDIGERRGK